MDDGNEVLVQSLISLLHSAGKDIVGVETLEVDEDVAGYLLQLLQSGAEEDTLVDAMEDVRPFISDLFGEEVPEDKCDKIVSLICTEVLKFDVQKLSTTAPTPSSEVEKLSEEMCAAQIDSEDPPSPHFVPVSRTKNTELPDQHFDQKVSKAKERAAQRAEKRRKQSAKRLEQRKEETQKAQEAEALARTDKEKVWSTNRFQRFHETWVGKGNWKVHDHAASLDVDELDDDDYSSAWLECLRLGIPWGGRGAGGRGVARITGETKDVHVNNVTMARGTTQLLVGATLKLVREHRYGLIGRNGVGKTTLLRRIALGTLPGVPPWLRVQHVQQEIPASDETPVQYALRYDHERTRLLEEEAALVEGGQSDQPQRLQEVHARLEAIDAWNAPERATQILLELGFSKKMCGESCRALSGGWMMRVGLAGALLMEPDILVLDEPTNHLDLQAITWLQEHLVKCEQIVLFVSHDRNFFNSVATDTIDFRNKQLFYFPGNLDAYDQRLREKRAGQARKLQAQEKQKAHLQTYIDSQRAAAKDKKAKGGDPKKQQQIKSKQLRMEKMSRINESGKRVRQSYGVHTTLAYDQEEKPATFSLHPCSELYSSGPIVQLNEVSFRYPPPAGQDNDDQHYILRKVDLQLWSNSKVGVLGNNGAGKSTLVKMITGSNQPTKGKVFVHNNVKIGYFAQDIVNDLDKEKTPTEIIMELKPGMTMLDARKHLGTVGLAGDLALSKIGTLSGGQKSRVAFAQETFGQPQLLILDEPTNHLDISTIQALGESIKKFNGCVLVVSHDVSFLESCCSDLWGVANGEVKVLVQNSAKSTEKVDEELEKVNKQQFHKALTSFVASQTC